MVLSLICSFSIFPSNTVQLRSYESLTIPVADHFNGIEFKEDISSCYVGFHMFEPQNETRSSDMNVHVTLLGSTYDHKYLPQGTNVSISWYFLNGNISCSVSPNHDTALNITKNSNSTTHKYFNFEVIQAGEYRVTFTNPTTTIQNFTYQIIYDFFSPFTEMGTYIEPIIRPGGVRYDFDLEEWVDLVYIPANPLSLKEISYVTLTNIYGDPINVKYRLKGTVIGDNNFIFSTIGALIIFPIVIWGVSKWERGLKIESRWRRERKKMG